MCAKIAITSDGIKSFKNDIEVTHGVKINRQRIAVGSDVENPVCIIFPNYVEEIAEGAFKNLNSLAAIYIPENVKKIGLDAFVGCTDLHRVIVHESIETIKMRDPQGNREITSQKPFDKLKAAPDGGYDGQLAQDLKNGGYVVYLYKSGEDTSEY